MHLHGDGHTTKLGMLELKAKDTIEALGIYLDSNVEWTPHIYQQVTRVNKIINGLRIIRRKFNTRQLSQIVTSQVFGILYCGIATWLTSSTKSTDFKKLTWLHYAVSRIIVGD